MKLVLLHEPSSWGHHPLYACLISEGFLRLGYLTCVVCASPKEVKAWLKKTSKPEQLRNVLIIKAVAKPVDLFGFLKPFLIPLFNRKVVKWLLLKFYLIIAELHFRKKVDLIFIGKIEDFIPHRLPVFIFDFLIRRNWTGLLIFPKTKGTGLAFDFKSLRAIERCSFFKCLFCLNENIIPRLKRFLSKPIFHFPDFSYRFPRKRLFLDAKIREIAGSRKIVGVFGVLDFRKGIMELLDFASSPYGKRFYFFICGTSYDAQSRIQVDAFEKKMKGLQLNNIFYINKKINFQQFDAYIRIADVIWLCYKNFPHSSNVLTRASLCKKPVVCVPGGVIESRINRFCLGTVASGFSPVDLHRAFSQAVLCKKKIGFSNYSDYHSLKTFLDNFSEVCR